MWEAVALLVVGLAALLGAPTAEGLQLVSVETGQLNPEWLDFSGPVADLVKEDSNGVRFDLPANNFVIFVNLVGNTVALHQYGMCEIYAATTGAEFVSLYTSFGPFQGDDISPSVLLTSFASEEVPEMQSVLGVPVRKYFIPLATMTPDNGEFDQFIVVNYGPIEGSGISAEDASAQVDIRALVFTSLDATELPPSVSASPPPSLQPSPEELFSSPPPPSPSPPPPSLLPPPPLGSGFIDLTPLQVQELIQEKCGSRKVVFIGPTATEYTATDLAGECIFGNDESNTIYGGPGPDVIFGMRGNDKIFGRGGDDILYGNRGSDVMHGQGGKDVLWGQRGRDWLGGGDDQDVLMGGLHRDTYFHCGKSTFIQKPVRNEQDIVNC